MICARLQLQERLKPKVKLENCTTTDKPRRYCQKRMINPDHEEDLRWTDVFERYHCLNETNSNQKETPECSRVQQNAEDLFLSVQTLKFQGDIEQIKKTKTNFKYKTLTDGVKHRMFVKQVVPEYDCDDDTSSQLTCYYFDDYVKYLSSNNDKSRPVSSKSSIHQGINDKKENKPVHIDVEQIGDNVKKSRKVESKVKTFFKKCVKQDIKDVIKKDESTIEDTKITFRKSGKRKCLTISRTQSPETVQVIRVDIVCNYNCSSVISDDDDKKGCKPSDTEMQMGKINLNNSHFSNKYLLTNSIKTLDENLPGGSKVTLLCRTFKLTDRSKFSSNKSSPANKKCTNVTKSITT